jgi:hypothetical protein
VATGQTAAVDEAASGQNGEARMGKQKTRRYPTWPGPCVLDAPAGDHLGFRGGTTGSSAGGVSGRNQPRVMERELCRLLETQGGLACVTESGGWEEVGSGGEVRERGAGADRRSGAVLACLPDGYFSVAWVPRTNNHHL